MLDVASCSFFRNFSNPLRIKIINLLLEECKCVNEISSTLNVEQSKVSHALSHLKASNIVYSTCMGKKRVYSINKRIVLPLLKLSKTYIAQQKEDTDC